MLIKLMFGIFLINIFFSEDYLYAFILCVYSMCSIYLYVKGDICYRKIRKKEAPLFTIFHLCNMIHNSSSQAVDPDLEKRPLTQLVHILAPAELNVFVGQ